MGFVSFEYLLFVSVLLPVYYLVGRRGQNVLLCLAGLGFVAYAEPYGALLLAAGNWLDFQLGRYLAWERPEAVRRRALWASLLLNLGLLAGFKYAGLVGTWLGVANIATGRVHAAVWIGLSFYTLQRSTHALDAYFRVLRPSTSWLEFATFAGFFPLLTAGPIERARRLLPQFAVRREFDLTNVYQACWLFALGLWKKVFIADHFGLAVKDLLGAHASATETWLGMYAYALQIYADFAGYSDMARASARLFGIEVVQNFELPYFSRSLAEYWQRWHVSLSSYLEDYVHKPTAMALRDWGTPGILGATFVTFVLSGLWHGTGWTFLVWGVLHALGLCAYALTRRARKRLQKRWPKRWAAIGGIATFHWVLFGYVFFRAPSLAAAFGTLARMFSPGSVASHHLDWAGELLLYTALLFGVDLLQRRSGHPFWVFETRHWVRVVCYATLLVCALRFYAPAEDFIYADF
jgi:alginate O-acetyltransferase complex protein AlgI